MTEYPLKLHIGGRVPKEGWKILDIQAGPNVDFVGSCVDLSQFGSESVDTVYASHVLEHLGYQSELPSALKELHRILKADGELMISVPDLQRLCKIFLHPELDGKTRFYVMRVMFGGQVDDHDFHKVGLTQEILAAYLKQAGFSKMQQVKQFDLFTDSSTNTVAGVPISLNVIVTK